MAEAYQFNGPVPEAVKQLSVSDLASEIVLVSDDVSPTPAALLEWLP